MRKGHLSLHGHTYAHQPDFFQEEPPFTLLNVLGYVSDSSVDIEMGYGPDGRGPIPGRDKIFLSSQQH
jgi:hypothetical protein